MIKELRRRLSYPGTLYTPYSFHPITNQHTIICRICVNSGGLAAVTLCYRVRWSKWDRRGGPGSNQNWTWLYKAWVICVGATPTEMRVMCQIWDAAVNNWSLPLRASRGPSSNTEEENEESGIKTKQWCGITAMSLDMNAQTHCALIRLAKAVRCELR